MQGRMSSKRPTLGLGGQVRIGQMGPAHGHHVGPALGNDLVGHARVLDAAHGDDRDADLFFDGLGQVSEKAEFGVH